MIQVSDAAVARYDAMTYNLIQCAVVAAVIAPALVWTGGLPHTARGWWVVVYMGVVVTVGTMVPWTWASRHLSATRVALILLLEPVVAALADAATGHRLSAVGIVGAACILAAAVFAELAPALRRSSTPVADGALRR
jgi:drug/metabolite transporter (DMT)-like permease